MSAAQRVTPEQIPAVADAVARGFLDNEIWAWVIPDGRRRARLLPRLYRTQLRRLFIPRGEAWTTPDAAGGAFWIPPGEPKRTRLDELQEALALGPSLGIAGARRGIRMDRLVEEHKPAEPHWYLEVLSIDPAHQRRGHGSALLRPVLERCDAGATPAYLETNRESSVPYYARFGFELTDKVALPDSPPLWLMWRRPATAP